MGTNQNGPVNNRPNRLYRHSKRRSVIYSIGYMRVAQWRSGTTLVMRVAPGEPSRVAVLAVDEGILQVARYKNPDPLGFFPEAHAGSGYYADSRSDPAGVQTLSGAGGAGRRRGRR